MEQGNKGQIIGQCLQKAVCRLFQNSLIQPRGLHLFTRSVKSTTIMPHPLHQKLSRSNCSVAAHSHHLIPYRLTSPAEFYFVFSAKNNSIRAWFVELIRGHLGNIYLDPATFQV